MPDPTDEQLIAGLPEPLQWFCKLVGLDIPVSEQVKIRAAILQLARERAQWKRLAEMWHAGALTPCPTCAERAESDAKGLAGVDEVLRELVKDLRCDGAASMNEFHAEECIARANAIEALARAQHQWSTQLEHQLTLHKAAIAEIERGYSERMRGVARVALIAAKRVVGRRWSAGPTPLCNDIDAIDLEAIIAEFTPGS